MKLAGAELSRFLRQPPDNVAAVLFYGPDEGLVKENCDTVVHAVLGGPADDPFRLTILSGDGLHKDPARLADEAAQLSLMGGRRVVRVRDASDTLTKLLAPLLEGPPGQSLLVLEAGDLGRASSLRKLFEAVGNAATYGCYPDGPDKIAELIKETLRQRRITIAPDALSFLVAHLGSDRLTTRQEIEKLSLHAGDGGSVALADAIASVGDTSALAIEDVVYNALDGNAVSVDAGLGRLFLEGESPVTILRAAQRHAQRLHLCGVKVAGGESAATVVESLRPPIYYKLVPRFRAQLSRWTPPRAQRLLAALTRAEFDCKTTGFPAETICRHLLSSLGGGQARR